MRLQALAWLLASSLALAASCRPAPLEPPRGAPVETKKPVAKPCEVERDVLGLTLGTHRFRPRAVETLQISADGRVILTAGTGAELWDAKSGERLRELASWLGRSSLSADGRRVATVDSGLMSSGVKVIAVDTGELVTALPVKDDDAEEIALDRKGERLASASRSGEVTLHELAGGAPTRRISADEGDVEALAFSPQADLLAIAGSKGRLQLWSFATGDEPQLLDAGGASLTAVAFSPNGRRLATADSRGLVRVFAIDGAGQATPKRSLEAAIPGEPRELRGVAITDDGRRVLVGTWSGVIALFDPTRPDPLAVLAEGGLVASGVAFTPDGRFAMGGVFHGALRFWDAETGEERRYDQPGNLAEPDAIVWSADGHRALVAAGAAGADVWDMRCGEMTGRLAGHRRRVEQLVASRDGRRVATGGNDGWLRLWDGETLERLHETQNHFGDVEALALSDDGTVVATGSREGAILVRDTKSFGIVFERPADDGADTVISLALAPARGLLLAGDVMGRVAWLDLASGAPLALREDDYPNNIRGIQLSPDGARVSTHASDRVRIFDAATSANTVTFKTSGWTISNVSWFADSRRIAFGDSDGRVWLADAIDGRVIAGGAIEDGDIAVVALHHDESTLVTGQRDTTLKVWDVAALGAVPEEDRDRIEVTITPEAELATARPLPRPAHEQCGNKPSAGLPACALHRLGPPTFRLEESLREVGALTFSPDAGLLVAGGSERLSVFEVPSGRLKTELACCMVGPVAARFSPDGRWLAVTPWGGSTQLWEVASGRQRGRWPYSAAVLAVAEDGSAWAGATSKGAIYVNDRLGRNSRALSREDEPASEEEGLPQLALSRTGKHLLVLRAHYEVELWDVRSMTLSYSLRGDEQLPSQLEDVAISAIGFGKDGEIVVVADGRRHQRARGQWSSEPLPLVEGAEGLFCSADASLCAEPQEGGINLARVGEPARELKLGDLDRLTIDASGKWLAFANDLDLALVDLKRGRRVNPPTPTARALSMDRNDRLLTLQDDDLRLWHLPADAPDQILRADAETVRLTRDGTTIVALTDEALIAIEPRTGASETLAKGAFLRGPALAANGKRALAVRRAGDDDEELVVVDLGSGAVVWQRRSTESFGPGLALSEDGAFAAWGADEAIEIWSVKGARLATIDAEHESAALAFTQDGSRLLAAGGGHIDVYDARDGAHQGFLGDHPSISGFDLSRDSRLVVTVGYDRMLRVFDLERRQLLATLAGHDRPIIDVAVGSDRVSTLGGDGTVIQWDLRRWR